jgi:hypothetical protein
VDSAAKFLRLRAAALGGLAPLSLVDEQATRDAVIAAFRAHLGQAGQGDTALFWFSGHGSLTPVPEQAHLEPIGLSQSLMCVDSRHGSVPDLLDIGLYELAGPHCKTPNGPRGRPCAPPATGSSPLVAPAVDGLDLAQAWQTLLDWAASRHAELADSAEQLDRDLAELHAEGGRASESLRQLLASHGIELGAARGSATAASKSGTVGSAAGEGTVAQQAPAALAAHREGARRDLADLRGRRDEAQGLAEEVARLKKQREVADKLGLLLRSDGFERWLCASALDSLVIEASETLLKLSGGQYELDRGERNELFVIDHNDAATRRPVNTLSGGETFQASLSLALALSRQVVGLSAGGDRWTPCSWTRASAPWTNPR